MSRWYSRAGEMVSGAGPVRARRENLVPSVTTVLETIAKPGLQKWIEREGIRAALRSPLRAGEDEELAIKRVCEERWQAQRQVTETGTLVHAALERMVAAWPDWRSALPAEPLRALTEPVMEWLSSRIDRSWTAAAEVQVMHPWGYAGTADAVFRGPAKALHPWGHGGSADPMYRGGENWLIDFKTQRPSKYSNGKLRTYPEWIYQLAAYGRALGWDSEAAMVWSIVIDVSGSAVKKHVFHNWSPIEIQEGWSTFMAILGVHKSLTFDPEFDEPVCSCGVPAALGRCQACTDRMGLDVDLEGLL